MQILVNTHGMAGIPVCGLLVHQLLGCADACRIECGNVNLAVVSFGVACGVGIVHIVAFHHHAFCVGCMNHETRCHIGRLLKTRVPNLHLAEIGTAVECYDTMFGNRS